MRSLGWVSLGVVVLACGARSRPAGGCSSDAACGTASFCVAGTCDRASGTCAYAYDPAMAQVVLTGSFGSGPSANVALATTSGGAAPLLYTICPGGPDAAASPPRCIVEIDVARAALAWQPSGSTGYRVTGSVPIRLADLPVDLTLNGVAVSAALSITGNHACPPFPETEVDMPVDASVDLGTPPVAQLGYAIDTTATAAALSSATTFCSGASFADVLAPLVQDWIGEEIRAEFARHIEAQLCATPAQGPCPAGTSDTGDGVCRFSAGGPCATRAPSSTGLVEPPACRGA